MRASGKCSAGRSGKSGHPVPAGSAYARWRAAELMVREGLREVRAGQTPGEEANIAKMLAGRSLLGFPEAWSANPWRLRFAEEYDIERKFRETRLYQVAPQHDLILSYIAEHYLVAKELLTMPASKPVMTGGCQCGAVRYALY